LTELGIYSKVSIVGTAIQSAKEKELAYLRLASRELPATLPDE